MAWQTPLLTMANATFLLMSATMGRTEFFRDVVQNLTQRDTVIVASSQRPVPLDFEYSTERLVHTVEGLAEEGKVAAHPSPPTTCPCSPSRLLGQPRRA